MTGKEAYEEKYKVKINNIIKNNLDKPYLKGFYNYMGSSRLSCSTMYDYINYIVNFMNYLNKEVENLDLDDYTDFLSQIDKKSATYQISVYSGLKKFAKYLMASKKASYNPMDYIDRPKFAESEATIAKREIGYLDKKEIRKYLSTVKTGVGTKRAIARQDSWKERDILITMIFLNTGMRCSALYKLDVDSIDLENLVLMANDKGNKVHTYDISEDLAKYIYDWLDKRESILGDVKENALFISNQRTRMDQSSIYRVVNKYASNIKDKHITPHKLRATYGTQLLQETNDIYFVQECMGHTNPKTTELYIRGQKSINRRKSSEIMSKITI